MAKPTTATLSTLARPSKTRESRLEKSCLLLSAKGGANARRISVFSIAITPMAPGRIPKGSVWARDAPLKKNSSLVKGVGGKDRCLRVIVKVTRAAALTTTGARKTGERVSSLRVRFDL